MASPFDMLNQVIRCVLREPVMFAFLAAACLAADPAPAARPALTGVVQDGSGKPLANATVFIRTAAPRQGVGIL
jgi:hypothetical protein